MKRGAISWVVALSLIGASGCLTDPPIDEGSAPAESAVVSGDVIVLYPLEEAHPVILFLYALNEQGEPDEYPTNITVIPADALGEEVDSVGNVIRTGEYAFPLVPAGRYIVNGLVDVDENFNPLLPDSGASEGDLIGAYVDMLSGEYLVVSVSSNETADEVNIPFSTVVGAE